MRNLSTNIVKFKRQPPRRVGEGFGGYLKPRHEIMDLSVCNDKLAEEAKLFKTNAAKNLKMGMDLRRTLSRDLRMYRQTEFLKNIELENSREARVKELDRMKRLRRMGNSYSSYSTTLQSILDSIE